MPDQRPARMPRRPDIQGLRALAVVLVVLFHAGLHVPGGFIGVDVFFAISGFVITGTLLAELSATGRIDLGRFYMRRVLRLLPALGLMVTVVAALGTFASPAATQRTGAVTGIFASLFAANFYLGHLPTGYFDVSATFNPLLHTWTLGVEEQFYILFPTLLFVSWRFGRRATAVLAVALVSLISLFLARQLSGSAIGGASGPRLAFYGSPARAWEFGAGALVALLSPWLVRLPKRIAEAMRVLGLAAVAIAAFAYYDAAAFSAKRVLIPVAGAALLLAAGTASHGGFGRLLTIRPAVWVGDLSYSWYLWHWPVIVFAKALWPYTAGIAPTAAAASLLPAWLSYRFVENPIRSGPRRRGRRVVAIAAACIVVPSAACLGLVGVSHVLQTQPAMKSWLHSQDLHADERRGCDGKEPLGRRGNARCTWSVASPRGQVVLVGDSNASHFTEGFVRGANRAGYDATVATFDGCPLVDVEVTGPNREADCRGFLTGTLAALVRLKPSLVILAARPSSYIEGTYGGIGDPRSKFISHVPSVKARLYERGLGSVLRRLNRAGIPIVLAHPVPHVPIPAGGCAVVRILTRTCGRSVPRKDVDESMRRSLTLEDRAAATASRTWTIDFENALCTSERCSSARGNTIMYLNSDHLSIAGATALTEAFRRAIVTHARAAH